MIRTIQKRFELSRYARYVLVSQDSFYLHTIFTFVWNRLVGGIYAVCSTRPAPSNGYLVNDGRRGLDIASQSVRLYKFFLGTLS